MHNKSHFLISSSPADLIPVLISVFTGLIYVYLCFKLQKKGKKWRSWQLYSFLTGTLLVGIAMSPAMMHWGHADFRGHMVQHLLIAMYAPLFLILGSPVTLFLKTLPPDTSRRFVNIFRYKPFYAAGHPATAFILNTGGMFVLYLTPLYHLSLNIPILHYFIHVHFLVAGLLFTWTIIGPDAAPNRPGLPARLMVLFFSIAAHAFLSKLMYAYLLPENTPYSEFQIKEGAKLMYYWGDLSEMLLLVILFLFWFHNKNRSKQNITLLPN